MPGAGASQPLEVGVFEHQLLVLVALVRQSLEDLFLRRLPLLPLLDEEHPESERQAENLDGIEVEFGDL